MTRDDIINMIADWIQAARNAGKPSVQLQWIDPMLSLRAEDEDWFLISRDGKIDEGTMVSPFWQKEIPDLKLRDVGKRVTDHMRCDDQRNSLQLATALFDELVDI